MSKKYDIESFLTDLKSNLQAGLNDKLTSITDEKADGLDLKPVDASAYFLQTMNEKIANFDPFIFYGIEGSQTEGLGPVSAIKWTINVALILIEQTDLQIVARLLRYQRAMRELFEEQWADAGDAIKIKLENMAPISFKLVDSDELFRAIGISIEITIV
jgi:hypothetical protein